MIGAAIGWAWAVIGCWLGLRWGHRSLRRLALIAVIWPIGLWIAACEWADRRAQEAAER